MTQSRPAPKCDGETGETPETSGGGSTRSARNPTGILLTTLVRPERQKPVLPGQGQAFSFGIQGHKGEKGAETDGGAKGCRKTGKQGPVAEQGKAGGHQVVGVGFSLRRGIRKYGPRQERRQEQQHRG